ncbi:hypothetical protein BG452_05420 [Streptomyces sp. CBMA123]|nr:hypothetical protein [Streptomyces sp. CBMA123]
MAVIIWSEATVNRAGVPSKVGSWVVARWFPVRVTAATPVGPEAGLAPLTVGMSRWTKVRPPALPPG